jgi:cell wall-associated NlpC family hydrolase
MAVTREQIVAEARTWLGTPWKHGVTDCAQLIMRVGDKCEGFRPGALDDDYMKQFIGYGRAPVPKMMLKALNFLLIKVDDPKLGDVCLFFSEGAPQHLGIVSHRPGANLYVIHGYNKPNIMGVVESRIVNPGHILGVWQYPMVEE